MTTEYSEVPQPSISQTKVRSDGGTREIRYDKLQFVPGGVAANLAALPLILGVKNAEYALGLRTVLSRHIGELPSSNPVADRLAGSSSRWLRAVILLRGLLRNETIGHEIAAREAAKLLAQLEAFPPPEPQPIPVWHIGEGSPQEFAQRFVDRAHPVVIKGAKVPAMRWSLDWFKRTFGNTQVLLTDLDDGRNFYAPLSNLDKTNALGHTPYLHNSGRIFAEYPEILDELAMPSFEPYLRAKSDFKCCQLFLSNRVGTGTPFHCAGNYNIFYQIEGQKRWTFVDPTFALLMYPMTSKQNTYFGSAVGMPDDGASIRAPLYRHCPRFTATLEPGDLLLNPPWWYHAVENVTEVTTAVATRWWPNPMPDTNRLFTYLSWFEPRKLAEHATQMVRGFNGHLAFEQGAHDDSHGELVEGVANAAWGLGSKPPVRA